jgi:hypothetical protein
VAQVVGVAPIDQVDAVRLAAFIEFKPELAYAITQRLSVRAGSQLLGLSNTYRAANQIRTTDLAAGTSSLHSTTLLLSSFYAGLNYKY